MYACCWHLSVIRIILLDGHERLRMRAQLKLKLQILLVRMRKFDRRVEYTCSYAISFIALACLRNQRSEIRTWIRIRIEDFFFTFIH